MLGSVGVGYHQPGSAGRLSLEKKAHGATRYASAGAMFLAHNLIMSEHMKKNPTGSSAGGSTQPALGNDLTDEQVKMLDYYRQNISFPAPPLLCMATAAVVVLEAGSGEEEYLPMADLTQIGELQLMVTDVDEAFPRFAELTGGRQISALRVLGFEEGGMVFVGGVANRASAARLRVHADAAHKRYVFAKDIRGKWLLPTGDSESRTLVLVAEAAPAPHLDAMDGTKTLLGRASTVAKPMVDAAGAAVIHGAEYTYTSVGRGLEATSAAVAPVLEATKENVGRGVEATSAAVAPAWEATKQNVGPVLEATRDNVGRGLEATTAAVGPAWEATKQMGPVLEATVTATRENVGRGLEATSAAVAPVASAAWAGTKEHVGKGLQAANDAMAPAVAPAWEATTRAAAPMIEVTRETTRKGIEVTSAAVGPAWQVTTQTLEATSAAVGPAWEATKQNVGKGIEVTSAAVAPAWEATRNAAAPVVTPMVETTRPVVGPVVEAAAGATAAMAPAAQAVWDTTASAVGHGVGATRTVLANVSEVVSSSMKDFIGPPSTEPPAAEPPVEAS